MQGFGINITTMGLESCRWTCVSVRMQVTIFVQLGIMKKKMEATKLYWGYIGIMKKKMEATILCWGYFGIMEKKMKTTILY